MEKMAAGSSSSSNGLSMYLIESKAGAVACMLLSLFFLGTWPAIFVHLERSGRLPQHTFLDYTLTNFLSALIIAFTLGQIGNGTSSEPNFLDQLSQDNWPSVLFAMSSGITLAMGNLATQYAFALSGLSVTLVITASLTVVLGTSVNYFLDDKINDALILFPGVGCFLIAVILASAVHVSNEDDNRKKLSLLDGEKIEDRSSRYAAAKGVSQNDDVEASTSFLEKAEAGTAYFLIDLENKRSIKVFRKNKFLGTGISFVAGLCFALFSPLFNLATNDQLHTLKAGVPHLTVYTAFFYFSVSCFIVSAVLNISFLYRPVLDLPKSSFKAYTSDWDGRWWALLAGLLCGLGNGLQFMGGEAAGYAAADAVQALPLVSTFWAIVVFGEYRKSSRRTYILLGSMLFMFIVAVTLLIASAGQRSESTLSVLYS